MWDCRPGLRPRCRGVESSSRFSPRSCPVIDDSSGPEQSFEQDAIDDPLEPHLAVDGHDRDRGVIPRTQVGIGVDVHHVDGEPVLAPVFLQEIERLVAAAAPFAGVDGEPRGDRPCAAIAGGPGGTGGRSWRWRLLGFRKGADLDEVVEEGGPAPHVGQGGRGGVVDVGPARAELAPVDPGRDGHARPDVPGQGDPGAELAARRWRPRPTGRRRGRAPRRPRRPSRPSGRRRDCGGGPGSRRSSSGSGAAGG